MVIKVINNMLGKGKTLDSEGMGYGNYVAILHTDNIVTLYGHLKDVHVKKGDTVKQGDIVGFMGETGYANGVHLHFEIRKYRINPTEDNLNQTILFDFIDSEPYLDIELPKNEYFKQNSELNENSYSDYTEKNKGYHVKKAFKDWGTSKGVYRIWLNAFKQWKKYKDEGYHIYDADGKQLDSENVNVAPVQPEVKLERVQIGLFRIKSNAIRRAKAIKSQGINAIIKKKESLYRVQVGAFSQHSNAVNMLERVKKLGYTDAFITTDDNGTEVSYN